MGENYYQKRPEILTNAEKRMHTALTEAFPHYIINSQVALSQLVEAHRNGNWQTNFNKISRLVVDFVITNEAHQPIACIELDDWTHTRPHRIDADNRKNKALAEAGYLLIRFNEVPSKDEIIEAFENAKRKRHEKIQEEIATNANKYSWQEQPKKPIPASFFGLIIAGMGAMVLYSTFIKKAPEQLTKITQPKESQAQQIHDYDNAPNNNWIRLRPRLFINPEMSQKDGSYSIAFIRNNGEIQKILVDCKAQGILNNGWKYQGKTSKLENEIIKLGCL